MASYLLMPSILVIESISCSAGWCAIVSNATRSRCQHSRENALYDYNPDALDSITNINT